MGSRIFQQNRALGYVSNEVSASVRYIYKRRENVVVTCVGKSFHTYECGHFRLICVSGLHPEDISCIASDPYLVYAASGKVIYGWRAGTSVKRIFKGHTENIHLLLPFGGHLISVDSKSVLKIWDIKAEDLYLEIPFQNDSFKISAIMHPHTYVNKILLGSEQGNLQLWNIKSCKLIHTFTDMESKINILEQAPAMDVAAIGLRNGRIVLLNLKFDEIVMEFKQDWGPVTQLSFRTDGHSIMASGSTNGQITFWDLEEQKITNTLTAHDGAVTTLRCLPSEPLMLTTSPDNSMKLWIFDMPDGGPRLLRIREGHAAPPICIRYHGASGGSILSSGEDSALRIFSTISETLNKSMGTASYNRKASKKKKNIEEDTLKMPPILHFTTETTREKEWDNIAAIHDGLVMTTTWTFNKCKMGQLKLVPEKFQNKNRQDYTSTTSCICLSHCGNFVTIGYSSGDVVRFNIQSGIQREIYGNPVAHKMAIRGIASDNLNQVMVTACSGGIIKFWNFYKPGSTPIDVVELPHGVLFLRSHRESSMLCVALENFDINILDLDTRTIVRRFSGHVAEITDACFSPDSRWLITASMDCTIKIWDIPTSYLIDHFKTKNACISLSMSPTGDFLATAHTDFLGIYLWANKSMYEHMSLRSIPPESEPELIELSIVQQALEPIISSLAEIDLGEKIDYDYLTPAQLDCSLITMSQQATSKWQNLLDLDLIKKRNKPKAPPQKPKQAPFFLPTVAGLDFQFDVTKTTGVDETGDSRVIKSTTVSNLTDLSKLLKNTIGSDDFKEAMNYLEKLGPSKIDYEIKSLAFGGNLMINLMLQFMKLIVNMMSTNLHFELAQTYLGVFLKSHNQVLLEDERLHDYLEVVEKAQIRGWQVLENQLLYGIGVVNTLRNYVA